MKPSYLVSRLLMPVFASMLALSLSANYSFADALVVDVDAGTITDNVTVESSADGDVAGVTIGDSTEVDEFSGAISVTDTTGSSGSYVRGLYITGNNKSGSEDTTSSLDLFSGTIEVSSVDGYARGIELEGSYTSSSNTYTGGNYLGEITADSTITVSSDTYSSWGIRNQFSTIGAINGTISSTSAGSASTSALYNDSGTVGTIAGTLESTQEGSGTTRTIWNAWNGHNPATIDSITGTITATGNTGTTTAIYNLGTIDYLNASVSATASTGSIFGTASDVARKFRASSLS